MKRVYFGLSVIFFVTGFLAMSAPIFFKINGLVESVAEALAFLFFIFACLFSYATYWLQDREIKQLEALRKTANKRFDVLAGNSISKPVTDNPPDNIQIC